jgi:hypothetical protein
LNATALAGLIRADIELITLAKGRVSDPWICVRVCNVCLGVVCVFCLCGRLYDRILFPLL